jgi:tetratricopeptide (TPR) repeat protein
MATTESATAQELQATLTDPRYLRGVTLLKEKRLEESVVAFEDLLRTMCEAEGKSDSLAVAPVYYEYGHALLTLTEATASLFGGAVEGAASGGNGDAEQDARDAADDLEAAWEVMEVARVIYSRYPGDQAVENQLARVYTRLGDLGLESDQFEQAKADFEKALLLRRKLLRASKAEDTTQLADLYCQLAIACIYRDSSADKEEDKEAGADDELSYYVMAGRVMAENIHRLAKKFDDKVKTFVEERIPKYSLEQEDAEPKGKGKRKAPSAAEDETLTLQFKGGRPDALSDEFLEAVNIKKEEKEKLKDDEKTLLEYMEIYLELKEKVDGIKETSAGAVAAEKAVTTVGFGQPEASAPATPAVNVISVKKRKTETKAEAAASTAGD